MEHFVLAGLFGNFREYFDVCAHVSVCASVFMVVALSFERHFAICSPHAYRIHLRTTDRWKHLTMYILPVTLLALIVNIPMFVNLQVRKSKGFCLASAANWLLLQLCFLTIMLDNVKALPRALPPLHKSKLTCYSCY